MTNKKALSIVQAKHGKPGGIRDRGKRSSADMRKYHSDQLTALGPRVPEPSVWDKSIPETMTVAEFRALLKDYRARGDEWKKERDKHWGAAHYRRYSVGRLSRDILGMGRAFFSEGEGDTWEEALKNAGFKLPEKQKRDVPTCKKCDGEHWPFQACE